MFVNFTYSSCTYVFYYLSFLLLCLFILPIHWAALFVYITYPLSCFACLYYLSIELLCLFILPIHWAAMLIHITYPLSCYVCLYYLSFKLVCLSMTYPLVERYYAHPLSDLYVKMSGNKSPEALEQCYTTDVDLA